MSDHFTYKDKDDFDITCLHQGDVLEKTEELTKILEKVHPHFNSSDYNHFIVLSQSCDLVRRNNGFTNSKYITIAVIRPLEYAIRREAESIRTYTLEKKISNIIDDKNNSKLTEILNRLCNNNIHDYFYLHPSERVIKFDTPSVAFLRVSIALKSEYHYDNLLNSKILELEDNFKAKLGWLVGNLYSRVGTKDWELSELKTFVRNQISSFYTIKSNIKDIEEVLKKNNIFDTINEIPLPELEAILRTTKIPTRKEKVISRLEEIIRNSSAEIDVSKLMKNIQNDEYLTSCLK